MSPALRADRSIVEEIRTLTRPSQLLAIALDQVAETGPRNERGNRSCSRFNLLVCLFTEKYRLQGLAIDSGLFLHLHISTEQISSQEWLDKVFYQRLVGKLM